MMSAKIKVQTGEIKERPPEVIDKELQKLGAEACRYEEECLEKMGVAQEDDRTRAR